MSISDCIWDDCEAISPKKAYRWTTWAAEWTKDVTTYQKFTRSAATRFELKRARFSASGHLPELLLGRTKKRNTPNGHASKEGATRNTRFPASAHSRDNGWVRDWCWIQKHLKLGAVMASLLLCKNTIGVGNKGRKRRRLWRSILAYSHVMPKVWTLTDKNHATGIDAALTLYRVCLCR